MTQHHDPLQRFAMRGVNTQTEIDKQLRMFEEAKGPGTVEALQFLVAHGGIGVLGTDEVRDVAHGIVLAWDIVRDGEWHTREEIEARHPHTEAMRRVRDLRPHLEEHGWTVECQRKPGVKARVFEYRIVREVT